MVCKCKEFGVKVAVKNPELNKNPVHPAALETSLTGIDAPLGVYRMSRKAVFFLFPFAAELLLVCSD